jgi:hypothetical protein
MTATEWSATQACCLLEKLLASVALFDSAKVERLAADMPRAVFQTKTGCC